MSGQAEDQGELARLRAILLDCALAGETVAAWALAAQAGLSVEDLPDLLDALAREQHTAGRPLLAALAVARSEDAALARRLLEILYELGRYDGPLDGPEATAWLALERDDTITRFQAEQNAYIEMVDWLAGFMTNFTWVPFDKDNYPDLIGLEVHHGFQSNMEDMADILSEVGVLEAINFVSERDAEETERVIHRLQLRSAQPMARVRLRYRYLRKVITRFLRRASGQARPRQHSGDYRFVVSRDHVIPKAREAYTAGAPVFDEVLVCYIYNAACYSSLPDVRTPFMVPAEFLPAVEWLNKIGYATKVNDRFLWTEAITPAMVRAHCWTEEADSRTEIERAKLRRLIEEMPEALKERLVLFFRRGRRLAAVAYLSREFGWQLTEAKGAVDMLYADWYEANRGS